MQFLLLFNEIVCQSVNILMASTEIQMHFSAHFQVFTIFIQKYTCKNV